MGRIPGVVLAAATATALLTSLLTGCVGQAADPAALAGQPSVTGIGDPYFPMDGNAGIDVERYRIRDAYRFDSGRLTGRTTLTITSTSCSRSRRSGTAPAVRPTPNRRSTSS